MRTIIAAGGTGGHLFPALALAENLREKGAEILFLGRKGGMETKLLRGKGFQLRTISASSLKRGFSLATLSLPLIVLKGILESLTLFREFRPQVVVGTGGYVSVPVVLAAKAYKIPTILQEQNLLPGLATRLLAPLSEEVCLSFPESRRYLRGRLVVVPGNPVRRMRRWKKEEAHKRLGLGVKGRTILLLGGSQGAHSLNMALSEGMEALLRAGIGLIWQTGEGDYQWAAQISRGLKVKVEAFFEDMGLIYSASDLVISRAGASTIAELTLFGLPSVLIPYPFATKGHQRMNALSLERRGAALILENEALTGKTLVEKVIPLLRDDKRLNKMAAASAGLGRPRAAEEMADSILRLANGG